MSALNTTATIQNALIEHSVIIVDGLAIARIFCRCGWKLTEMGRTAAEASRALHQSEKIMEALIRFSDDIVDAETEDL